MALFGAIYLGRGAWAVWLHPLSDPSLETTMYKLEKVDPIPPNFTSFSQFVAMYATANQLNEEQRRWIIYAVKEHLPFWLIALWEGFPEWDYLNQVLNESRIQFAVGPVQVAGGARFMRLIMAEKILAEAYI